MPPVARPARSNCRTSDSALLSAAQLGQGLDDLLLALDDFGQEADAVDVAVVIPGGLHQDAGLLMETTWDNNGDIDRISFLAEVVEGKQKIVQTLPKLGSGK